jgi:hypothetical protein
VTLTVIRSTEITIGKLRTAIRMWLLFAFAAMPESTVKEAENPIAPRVSTIQKSPRSAIGFLRNSTKSMKPVNERIIVSKKL